MRCVGGKAKFELSLIFTGGPGLSRKRIGKRKGVPLTCTSERANLHARAADNAGTTISTEAPVNPGVALSFQRQPGERMSQADSGLADPGLARAGQSRRCGLRGIKAVFFDLDNTLIDTAAAGRRAIAEVIKFLQSEYHCTEREADVICGKFEAKLRKECYDPSKISITNLRIQHWEGAIQEVKGEVANQKLARECYFLWKTTRLQHLTLAEETRKILCNLRKVARLLLLTNGDTETQREKIEACACQEFFDAIVIGGEQKEEKPAPSIFHHGCELLGVQPEDCVMVGDSLDTDIQGGLKAGLKATIWINKTGTVPKETSSVPHYTISSLLDLPRLLVDENLEMNQVANNICDSLTK